MYPSKHWIALTTRAKEDSCLVIVRDDPLKVNNSVTRSDPNGPRYQRGDRRPMGQLACVKFCRRSSLHAADKRYKALDRKPIVVRPLLSKNNFAGVRGFLLQRSKTFSKKEDLRNLLHRGSIGNRQLAIKNAFSWLPRLLLPLDRRAPPDTSSPLPAHCRNRFPKLLLCCTHRRRAGAHPSHRTRCRV